MRSEDAHKLIRGQRVLVQGVYGPEIMTVLRVDRELPRTEIFLVDVEGTPDSFDPVSVALLPGAQL